MIDFMVAIHSVAAVVMMGELLYSGLWLGRAVARGDAGLRPYVLATMRATSMSYALPAILINLLTGLALLHFKRTPIATAYWLWNALLLYVIVTALWHGVLIPQRKKMAALIGEPEKGRAKASGAGGAGAKGAGGEGPDFDTMARGWLGVNGIVVLMLFAIYVLMVWRPAFF